MRTHDKPIEFESKREHLEFDLHMAFDHGADWFTAHLFRLISKADIPNRNKLREAFPEEVEVYEGWRAGLVKYHSIPGDDYDDGGEEIPGVTDYE